MKYKINEFELDTDTRMLNSDSKQQAIRPKTLALLLYFLGRQEQIIDKQELLDNVWDDVQVNEGVVFQSIREIRQLFASNNIIQNHPRKGYQLIAKVSVIKETPSISQPTSSTRTYAWPRAAAALLSVFMIVIVVWQWQNQPTKLEGLDFDNRILVIPVTHQLDLGENQWLKLGGMELLIAKLSQMSESHFVYSSESTLQAIQVSNISNKVSQIERNKLFELSGATLILETEVIGDVYDYSVLFHLHSAVDSYSGIIPSPTIIEGLSAVASSIADQLSEPLAANTNVPKEFSDPDYIEAISVYEQDWASAITKFEAYLVSNPDSLLALRYLTKLYLWNEQVTLARNLVKRSLLLAQTNKPELAYALFNQALLAQIDGQFENALALLKKAENLLSKQKYWLLKSRIAETKGHLWVNLGDFDNAILFFQQALSFNQLIQSPIGTATMELHLCDVHLRRGDSAESLTLFNSAKQRIEEQNLLFLYSMLADYEQKVIRATSVTSKQ